ncbi:hypothetical protein EXN66_Car013111 [Channa argus]|uniref:Uncharacterized protein n=1 Tax=Channa argus TaxID=215402 RepID=A0A6G1Q486_CHAAH|nr:hypothetical protein EXN66_Car013111 [Channa argus]
MPAKILREETKDGVGGNKRQVAEERKTTNGGQVLCLSTQRNNSAKRTEKGVELVGEQRQMRSEIDGICVGGKKQEERARMQTELGGRRETTKEMRYEKDLTVSAEVVGEEKAKSWSVQVEYRETTNNAAMQ